MRSMIWVRSASLAILAIASPGCYSFQGGGGLPSHIQTAYVAPVENETTRFGLSEELTQGLLAATRERLGLQLATEESADAIISATVTRFADAAVNLQGQEGVGADVITRRITISATVAIVDAVNNIYIFQQSVVGVGEYEPQSDTDEVGTAVALDNLVQQVVDGAQSQW